jgi:hypothetical protein
MLRYILPLLLFPAFVTARTGIGINAGAAFCTASGAAINLKASYTFKAFEAGITWAEGNYAYKELFFNYHTRQGMGNHFYAGLNAGIDELTSRKYGGGDGYHAGVQLGYSHRLGKHVRLLVEASPRYISANLVKHSDDRYNMVGRKPWTTERTVSEIGMPVTAGITFYIGREKSKQK